MKFKKGEIVRYICRMPEGTWMALDWGRFDGLEIGQNYIVSDAPAGGNYIKLKGTPFQYRIDKKCFELVKRKKRKDDWSDAPDWAKYSAIDQYGIKYYYADKPKRGRYSWVPSGKSKPAEYKGWEKSLKKRPI